MLDRYGAVAADGGERDGAPEVDAVVEALPDGQISTDAFSSLRGNERVRAARQLAVAIGWSAEAAHEDVVPVGGIRPDATWVRRGQPEALVALAPRAVRLWAMRRPGDAGVAPGHLTVFEAPELLDGAQPTRPDDVFSLAASFWWWATGRHPFTSQGRDAQLLAIMMGEFEPWPGPAQLEPVLVASLGSRIGRPSFDTLLELLAA